MQRVPFASAPPTAGRLEDELWEVVVRPDRRFYEMIDPEDIEFPRQPPTADASPGRGPRAHRPPHR